MAIGWPMFTLAPYLFTSRHAIISLQRKIIQLYREKPRESQITRKQGAQPRPSAQHSTSPCSSLSQPLERTHRMPNSTPNILGCDVNEIAYKVGILNVDQEETSSTPDETAYMHVAQTPATYELSETMLNHAQGEDGVRKAPAASSFLNSQEASGNVLCKPTRANEKSAYILQESTKGNPTRGSVSTCQITLTTVLEDLTCGAYSEPHEPLEGSNDRDRTPCQSSSSSTVPTPDRALSPASTAGTHSPHKSANGAPIPPPKHESGTSLPSVKSKTLSDLFPHTSEEESSVAEFPSTTDSSGPSRCLELPAAQGTYIKPSIEHAVYDAPEDGVDTTSTYTSSTQENRSSQTDPNISSLLYMLPAAATQPIAAAGLHPCPVSDGPASSLIESLLLFDEAIPETLAVPLVPTVNLDLGDSSTLKDGSILRDFAVPTGRLGSLDDRPAAFAPPAVEAGLPATSTLITPLCGRPTFSHAVHPNSARQSVDSCSTASPASSAVTAATFVPANRPGSPSVLDLSLLSDLGPSTAAPATAILSGTDLVCSQRSAAKSGPHLIDSGCGTAAPSPSLPTSVMNPALSLPGVHYDLGTITATTDATPSDLTDTPGDMSATSPYLSDSLSEPADTGANPHILVSELEDIFPVIVPPDERTKAVIKAAVADFSSRDADDLASPGLPPSSPPCSQVSDFHLPPSQHGCRGGTSSVFSLANGKDHEKGNSEADMDIYLSQPSSSPPGQVFSSSPPLALNSPPTSPQLLPQGSGKDRISDAELDLESCLPDVEPKDMPKKRVATDDLADELPELKHARTTSYSPPPPPNPKRHTPLGQKRAYKKLIQPFRSPLVNIEDVLAGKDHVYTSGRAHPINKPAAKAEPQDDPGLETMSGGEIVDRAPSQPSQFIATKDRTANAGKPFKALVIQPNAAAVSPGTKTGSTLQALQARVQKLKQAIKIKHDREKSGDGHNLEALVSKWRSVGREVAWLVWDTVKDLDPGDSLKVAVPVRGEWDGDEVLPTKKRGHGSANDGFKDGWGWDGGKGGKHDGFDSNWGWDDRKDGEIVSGTEERATEDERTGMGEENVPTMNHSLGTMLRHLGIDPETLGWDEDEGDFVSEP
ncbi:uncharacterized protein PHACADRAFT_181699 [Phanerochaete carnosa HHB-10118-sp]|uniref:Uncharacterized protein n=1 Tax=Phanerochaete carnosa (strain HHB-10118-sp) TaxID=650164 RepID=K5WJZ1_PHACS|nr:uncharacterized protein PHACADRAFT_181699 [Phanerochaete carnosa HHB-10118-sp]EKM59730.1 hypothetical protein PHACADRAFT_181699 [Phanerochaete carnosa HHB-10118-sp]